MSLILRNAKIIDPHNDYHGKSVDISIANGRIAKIGVSLNVDGAREFSAANLHVSRGWFDSSVSFGEPGYEDRQTIANGLDAAAAGGFTSVAIQPNCDPVTDNQGQVRFILSKSDSHAVNAFPIGALTKNAQGKELAELFDMHAAGAVAFGDYNRNIDNSNLMKIALQYTQGFDGMVVAFCKDRHIAGSGLVNEGEYAVRLGLRGVPALAEELMVARNLHLLEYAGGKLHIPTISTIGSVDLIRKARKNGLNVTCSVAVHHLVLTDSALEGFDTRFKVTPPLRDELTRKALIEAVTDGTIDCITSDHNPIDIEHKKIEFDLAMDGTIGLESAFGALGTVLPTEIIVEKLISGKKVFGLPPDEISEGSPANLTLFDPDAEWTFSVSDIKSKSKNSAFVGMAMKGKPLGIISGEKHLLK